MTSTKETDKFRALLLAWGLCATATLLVLTIRSATDPDTGTAITGTNPAALDAPGEPGEPDTGLVCTVAQQILLELRPDSPAVATPEADNEWVGVGFGNNAMCLDLDVTFYDGFTPTSSTITVTRANGPTDAWDDYTLTQTIGPDSITEGAGSALPVIVPLPVDFTDTHTGLDTESDCYRIDAVVTVRGPKNVTGTWSATGVRGVCPGTRYTRDSLTDYAISVP